MDGAQGTDVASFSTSASPVVAASSSLGKSSATGDGADTLMAIEGLVGSSHDDLLYGDEGPNHLYGAAGRDLLAGKGGHDRLDGAGDVDTASFETAQTLINADLGIGQAVGDYGVSSLVSIENLIGSRWNDTLVGSAAANRIAGGDGNDAIGGSYGADVLAGEAGADRLSGGPDIDACDGGTNPVGSADTADQTCETTAGIP
jgi:Ca2+-binding RTX toxin-like protein